MKRRLGYTVLPLLLLSFLACGDENGPTAPAGALRADLSGHWTGTITYFQAEGELQAACALERINTVVTQTDMRVDASIVTSCHGTQQLSATIAGTALTGSLVGGPQGGGGQVTGTASASRIEITTSRRRGSEPIAINRIDLVR